MEAHDAEVKRENVSGTHNVPIIIVVILAGAVGWFGYNSYQKSNNLAPTVTTFDECVSAGNPVMESYPRQCRDAEGKIFSENIGNELEKKDLIRLTTPRPGQVISSPLMIRGEARGWWFFEASFPVTLVDSDNNLVARGIAQAQGEWMAEGFVPFEISIPFERPLASKHGVLILRRDNPSGLPEHDDALEIPVRFE